MRRPRTARRAANAKRTTARPGSPRAGRRRGQCLAAATAGSDLALEKERDHERVDGERLDER